MTRRPIFIGIATILALALTAGLAYGAGRMVSNRTYANQAGHRSSQVVATVPGSYTRNVNGHFADQRTGFRGQMRQWMRDRLQPWFGHAAFRRNGSTTANRNHGRQGSFNLGTSYRGGGSSHAGSGYRHHSGYHHAAGHMGSGSWGGGHSGGCCGW